MVTNPATRKMPLFLILSLWQRQAFAWQINEACGKKVKKKKKKKKKKKRMSQLWSEPGG